MLLEPPPPHDGTVATLAVAAFGVFGGPLRLLERSTTGVVAAVVGREEGLTCEESRRSGTMVLHWRDG